MSDLGIPEGTAPKRGEDLSGIDMYHRAKFHADRCHRRRDFVTGQRNNTATNTTGNNYMQRVSKKRPKFDWL